MMKLSFRLLARIAFLLLVLVLLAIGGVLAWFTSWRSDRLAALDGASEVADTTYGKVEFVLRGEGPTVLVFHGAPGGYDQALLLGERLSEEGFQVVAPSRPGYLRTPLASGILPEQQAAAALAQLSSEISQAQAQTAAPNSPSRQDLAHRVAELQQKALPLNNEAARNLGEASALLAEQNAPAAAQSLAAANAEIQQQSQAVARAAAQQQALQAVSNQVATAKAQASQARQTLQGTEGNQSAAIKQMESTQTTLQQAQQMAGGASPEVQNALQQAQQALNASKLNAAQMKKTEALAANAKAQENLQQAIQSINQSVAGAMAQAMPPTPSSPSESGPSEATGQNPDQMAQDGSSGGGGAGDPVRDAGWAGDDGTRPARPVTVGLRPAERAAVAALQKEKAPAEYQAMAQQYWKNLASGVSPGTPLR